MNDSELGLELAEIVRKEQEEATMLHREQKDVTKTDIPKRHKIDWDALTEEEYGSGVVCGPSASSWAMMTVGAHTITSKMLFPERSISQFLISTSFSTT